MSRVAIVFTGGTISMRPDAAAGGNVPALDGAAILALAPRVAELAEVEVIDWGMVPASHMRFGQILDIARVISAALDRPEIDGVVVVQGTDAIEETCFAFDLLIDSRKVVVVTGAMRDAEAVDYDGPRNMADAVATAISPDLRGAGVVVVMNGVVLAAEQAVKAHASALDAFRARDGQPLATVRDGEVSMLASSAPAGRRRLPDDAVLATAIDDVYLATVVMGMDGAMIRGLAPLKPRGLVVAAAGSGNSPPDVLAAAVELLSAGTVVCLTTRSPEGTVDPVYAFAGGGATWQRAGVILSALDGPKSRVALALALAAGLNREAIARLLSGDGKGNPL